MSANILRLTCPKCDTALSLKTAPAGGRCKCPKCGTTFATDAAALPEAKPALTKAASPALQKTPMPKAALTRPVKDDSDAVSVLPAEPAKKGNGLLLLLLGGGSVLVAGFFALMLLGGIIGLLVWKLNKSSPDTSDQQAAKVADSPAPSKEAPKDPQPNPPLGNPGDGSLAADVLQRTQQATLLIKVQMDNGQEGSGSGFFEESSGLIVTNAHVVGLLDPASKAKPRRIDVVLNSGTPNATTLPAKLIVVDSTSDLALLEVPTAPAQAKLKVTPAKDLKVTQRVYVCGFPLGEQANKNLTINPTNVSSLHRGNDGIVNKVQVNGGMDHGNSGGPVIDPQGNVVGVSFSGFENTSLKFAIPGESVHALLQGRVSGISVNNEAVSRTGRLYLPVTVTTLDPRQRITRIAFDYWVAPSNQPAPPPSDQQPNLGNTTSPRRTVEADYDPVQQVARAELVLDMLPDSNNRLWIQTVATNGSGKTAWLSGIAYEVDPPVDAKPATLKAQFRQGTVPVHLTTTARFKVTGDDEPFSLLQNLDTDLNEQTKMLPPTGGAQMQLTVRKFATGISKNNQQVATTPEWQKATSQDIGQLALDHDADDKGNLKTKRVTFVKQVPVESRLYLEPLGKQLNQSFDIVALPQPGNLMQPGQTWQAKRELPTPLLLDDILNSVPIDMNYTFRGVRQHKGRSVAVVDLRATLKENIRGRRGLTITLTGQVTGTVLVDPDTGVVVQAKALTDTTLVARSRSDTVQITGTLDIRLQRGN